MIITALFGIINSTVYIITEIVEVMTRDSMVGYFNVLGMITVILSLILIFTNIPSVICQVKIMKLEKVRVNESNLIDQVENRIKIPSYFLRTSNLIFVITFCFYGLSTLTYTLIFDSDSVTRNILIIISLILIICGLVLTFDGFKLKKQARTLF